MGGREGGREGGRVNSHSFLMDKETITRVVQLYRTTLPVGKISEKKKKKKKTIIITTQPANSDSSSGSSTCNLSMCVYCN